MEEAGAAAPVQRVAGLPAAVAEDRFGFFVAGLRVIEVGQIPKCESQPRVVGRECVRVRLRSQIHLFGLGERLVLVGERCSLHVLLPGQLLAADKGKGEKWNESDHDAQA